MPTDQKESEHCTICGDALTADEQVEALCEECTDAWARENESYW